jgi:hypothetical protein
MRRFRSISGAAGYIRPIVFHGPGLRQRLGSQSTGLFPFDRLSSLCSASASPRPILDPPPVMKMVFPWRFVSTLL